MYDELIKILRIYANDETDEIRFKAADAIEERQAVVDGLTAQTNMVFEKTEGRTVIKFEPKWIPVMERLPEENGEYLVHIICPKGKWIEINVFDGKDWKSTTDYWYEISTGYVTHWMPLPQPPEREEA